MWRVPMGEPPHHALYADLMSAVRDPWAPLTQCLHPMLLPMLLTYADHTSPLHDDSFADRALGRFHYREKGPFVYTVASEN